MHTQDNHSSRQRRDGRRRASLKARGHDNRCRRSGRHDCIARYQCLPSCRRGIKDLNAESRARRTTRCRHIKRAEYAIVGKIVLRGIRRSGGIECPGAGDQRTQINVVRRGRQRRNLGKRQRRAEQ